MTLKVLMEQPVCAARVHIWLYDEQDTRMWIAKPVEIIFEEVASYEATVWQKPPPTLDVSWSMWSRLCEEFPAAIAGQPLETRAIANAAELKATKSHLEDMRLLALQGVKRG